MKELDYKLNFLQGYNKETKKLVSKLDKLVRFIDENEKYLQANGLIKINIQYISEIIHDKNISNNHIIENMTVLFTDFLTEYDNYFEYEAKYLIKEFYYKYKAIKRDNYSLLAIACSSKGKNENEFSKEIFSTIYLEFLSKNRGYKIYRDKGCAKNFSFPFDTAEDRKGIRELNF